MFPQRPPFLLVLVMMTWPCVPVPAAREPVFTACGDRVNGTKFGFIHSPNFPRPFPVPLRCRWVIEAPAGKVIAVYFTQLYLREGLRATEYADYTDEVRNLGPDDFGPMSFDNHTTFLLTQKPVLVLDLNVADSGHNINMRVADYFLDVYGFNLTYEIINRGESVRKSACSVFHCSFNGNCFVSKSFDRYSCHCFKGFRGDECQYGPLCDPANDINMCKRGKMCRYSVGPQVYVCDCPPGYEGDRCESKACKMMNCTQLCVPRSRGFQCSCYAGYRLRSDNKTCIPHTRIRYLVRFKLKEPNFDPSIANKTSVQFTRLKSRIENELHSLLSKKLREVQNLTVLNFNAGAIVEFHFFGRIDDTDLARRLLNDALSRERIGETPVVKDYFQFEKEPALNLQRTYVLGERAVVAGKELTLACIAMGTSALEFHWFKDGMPITIEKSNRHMLHDIIPKNMNDQYTAVLIIENIHPLDKGIFTCEVSDWGESQKKSVSIHVVSAPTVNVTPAAITLRHSASLTIMCQSQEDSHGSFSYNWDKNGKILNPSDGHEIVEDLFPTGSRVKILQATHSATYTCIVSNSVEQSKGTSRVTVLSSDLIKTCPSEDTFGVRWMVTAVNTVDVQPCPPKYRGFCRGLCRDLCHRQCSLVADVAVWEEPEFSECMSTDLSNVCRNFEYLKLGYLSTNVTATLQEVRILLKNKADTILPGQGLPLLNLLSDIMDYDEKYEKNNKASRLDHLMVILEIMSLLLNNSHAINTPQKAILLHSQMRKQVLTLANQLTPNVSYVISHNPYVIEASTFLSNSSYSLNFPSNNSVLPTWLTDNVVIKIDAKDSNQKTNFPSNSSLDVAVVFFRNLSSFLPRHYLAKHEDGEQIEYIVDSHIVMVAAQKNKQDFHLGSNSVDVYVTFDQRERHGSNYSEWNITCGLANFAEKPQWTLSACSITVNENFTQCSCDRFGTYAVLLTNYVLEGEDSVNWEFDLIVDLCCTISLGLLLLTLIFLILFARKIQGGVFVLKFQICIGLIGAFGGFLLSSRTSLQIGSFPYIATTLEFFLLLPFSTQVCLELMVYLEMAHTYHVQNARTKVILIGWGIPVLVTGASIAAQSQTGFKFNSWWIQVGDIYFYGFVITSSILSLLYIILYLIVSSEFRHMRLAQSTKGKIAEKKLLQRSLIVQLFLIVMTVSSILYANSEDKSLRYFFAASTVNMGFTVFVLYGLKNDAPFFDCCKQKKDLDDISSEPPTRSESFRAFIKPDSTEEYILENNTSESVERLKKQEKLKKILRNSSDQSRETEDLLPDVTPSHETCGSLQQEDDDKNDLTAVAPMSLVNKEVPYPLSKIRLGKDMFPSTDKTDERHSFTNPLQPEPTDHNVNIVRYEGSPRKYPHTSLKNGSFRLRSFMPFQIKEEEEEVSEDISKHKPKKEILKPEPGFCYIKVDSPDPVIKKNDSCERVKETDSSRPSDKIDSSPHVTFGPVYRVPLEEEEEEYLTMSPEPPEQLPLPPLRFQDNRSASASLLKNRLPLKLDGLINPFPNDGANISHRDIPSQPTTEESTLPSGSTSPDSHDTAV